MTDIAEPRAGRPPEAPARSWTWAGVPPLRDARWGQLVALTVFCILGQTWLGWTVTPAEILLSVGTCVATDMTLTRIRRRELIVPLSGLITGLGLAMLLRSSYPAVFVVAGMAGIASKHFITVDGHHRFNPGNFGLIVALAFTQGGVADITMGQWGRSGLLLFAIMAGGVLVVFRTQRLGLAVAYVAFEVAFSVLFHGGHLVTAEALSGDVLVFAFFMITDPKTAPRTWRGQLGFAAVIAFLGQLFASWGSMAAIFVAPFVVALAKPVVVGAYRALLRRRAAGGQLQSSSTALR